MAEPATNLSYLSGLLTSVAERGRALVGIRRAEPMSVEALLNLCQRLLKGRGEASGAVTATTILSAYAALNGADRRAFLSGVCERFGQDIEAMKSAARGSSASTRAATTARAGSSSRWA